MNRTELMPADQRVDWNHDKCDKYDYLISAFCGAAAGLLDVVFVGAPGKSVIGGSIDNAADKFVLLAARATGWKPSIGNENNVASAIGFFERNCSINYDHRSTSDVAGRFAMNTRNHHYKSLGHSPDVIGLFFSIIDQFSGTATFLNNGQLISIDTSENRFELRGGNLPAKLFCGFCNWLGHLISDMAGSSGSRGMGSSGRGSGIPIPFFELFQVCDFGSFRIGSDRQNLATLMTRVFQEGYDLRFGATMAIPVLIQDLMIRIIWALKKHYFSHRPWSECIPTDKHPDLRIMLIIGNGTLCLIDGIGATVASKGNALSFVLHLNIVAWARLVLLVFKEIKIRYGAQIEAAVGNFFASIGLADKYALRQYYERINAFSEQMDRQLTDFIRAVEAEYREFAASVDYIMDVNGATSQERLDKSIALARRYGVDENRIIHSAEELDAWVYGK